MHTSTYSLESLGKDFVRSETQSFTPHELNSITDGYSTSHITQNTHNASNQKAALLSAKRKNCLSLYNHISSNKLNMEQNKPGPNETPKQLYSLVISTPQNLSSSNRPKRNNGPVGTSNQLRSARSNKLTIGHSDLQSDSEYNHNFSRNTSQRKNTKPIYDDSVSNSVNESDFLSNTILRNDSYSSSNRRNRHTASTPTTANKHSSLETRRRQSLSNGKSFLNNRAYSADTNLEGRGINERNNLGRKITEPGNLATNDRAGSFAQGVTTNKDGVKSPEPEKSRKRAENTKQRVKLSYLQTPGPTTVANSPANSATTTVESITNDKHSNSFGSDDAKGSYDIKKSLVKLVMKLNKQYKSSKGAAKLMSMSENDLIDEIMLLVNIKKSQSSDGITDVNVNHTATVKEPMPTSSFFYANQPKIYSPSEYSKLIEEAKGPHLKDFSETPLIHTGPYKVGAAKACLDDLHAQLLEYYSNIYKTCAEVPVAFTLDSLSHKFYPAGFAKALNGASAFGNNVSESAHQLPSNGDSSLTKEQSELNLEESKARIPNPAPNQSIINLPNDKKNITNAKKNALNVEINSVVNELFDLTKNNTKHLDSVLEQLDDTIYDPTNNKYFRNRELSNPVGANYTSTGPYKTKLHELEDCVNKIYRNLRVTTDWNNKKISLLQDKLKILRAAEQQRPQC